MKIKSLFTAISLFAFQYSNAQYNQLWIPDTLTGTNFNLTIKDTFAQICNTGNQTITGGINGKFWGPTLFFKKGDVVTLKVCNIDRDAYNFFSTWEFAFQSIGNPFSQPNKVMGNISNGALGAFYGYGAVYKTLVIPK